MDKENNIVESCRVETFPSERQSTESTLATESSELSERIMRSKHTDYEIHNNAMNSFITVRPPRDPKHSQSVATSGSSNSASFHTHHYHPYQSKKHGQRSSSQPRSTQTAESMPPAEMQTSTRSFSQPRASQNSHFLDGFNVTDCFDVRTIPDPPEPSPNTSRRRHRRRVSSAVLRPMTSMDVSNRGNNQIATSSDHTFGSDIKSSSVTRRKRKTLSHVPSPINPEGQGSLAVSTGERGTYDERARAESQQISLGRDDFEDERAKLNPKRKKKRQSMVIPRSLPLEVNGSSSDTALVNDLNTESRTDENPTLRGKKKAIQLDFKSMQKLRKLVRGYCALSSGDDRGSSSAAKEILSMTGYALPQKTTTDGEYIKSEAVLSNRRLVIQKIAPVLARMESRKKQDVKQWENRTKCRVTKSERSGRYKYYDIETNKKVGSQEYKRRYLSVLEDDQTERMSKARFWMNGLNPDSNTQCTREKPEQSADVATLGFPTENIPVHQHSNFIATNHEEQNHAEIHSTQQKESSTPPMNANQVHDTSYSISTLDASERGEIAEITEASSEDTDDNPQESRPSSPSDSNTSDVATPMIVDDVNRNDVTENIPLLPLPSKDVESMDPDIAAAEKRLWDKIDLALHEYSGEVMMIQRKKRRLALAQPVTMNPTESAQNQNGKGN